MVLATDLSHNFAIINQFKTMLDVAGGAGAGSAPPRTRCDERHASGREPLFSSRAETITPAERLVSPSRLDPWSFRQHPIDWRPDPCRGRSRSRW